MTLFFWDKANLDDWKVASSIGSALRKVRLGRVLIPQIDSSNGSREAMILCKTRNKLFERKFNSTQSCKSYYKKAHDILTRIFESLQFPKGLRVGKCINV